MVKDNEVLNLSTLVQEAEQSIKNIRDPQMKSIAFGEVLKFLLEHRVRYKRKVYAKKTRKTSKMPKLRKDIKSEGTMTWLEELKGEKFFEKPKNANEILATLEERGHHLKPSDLTWPLQQCTKRKTLRRKKMEPVEGGKQVWYYSNW